MMIRHSVAACVPQHPSRLATLMGPSEPSDSSDSDSSNSDLATGASSVAEPEDCL